MRSGPGLQFVPFPIPLEIVMTRFVRLLEMFHVSSRFVESSKGAGARFAQPHRHVKASDADRIHVFEARRIRQNPASPIAPRF